MALADDLKTLVHSIRAIPGQFGLRPHTVAVVVADWDGDYTGRGTEYKSTTPLVEGNNQPPRVRWANDEQIALGELAKGTINIGPITPTEANVEALKPFLEGGQTLHLLVTGPVHPDGALYRIERIRSDRALHWLVRAEPVSNAGPVP